MITIKLKHGLNPEQENWLAKNIGPRLHYIHNSIGGKGWIAKKGYEQEERVDMGGSHIVNVITWKLTFEDDRYATWFRIMFPE